MEKTLLVKGMEMVENEREIREALITKSEGNSEELRKMTKEMAKYFEDMIRDKELSRSTRKELSKYARYLEEVVRLAKNLADFNALLKVTQAERAEVERENDKSKQ